MLEAILATSITAAPLMGPGIAGKEVFGYKPPFRELERGLTAFEIERSTLFFPLSNGQSVRVVPCLEGYFARRYFPDQLAPFINKKGAIYCRY